MATSDCMVQDVITCDLCYTPTQQFCNSCQVSLCEQCISKHRAEFKSLPHDIVPFLDRKIQLALPECPEHTGQRCDVHCKKCIKPVCVKCIVSGSHKSHDVEELTETYQRRKLEIKNETEEIKAKIIPNYRKEDGACEMKISMAKSKFDDLGKEINTHRQLWHQEVDKIFDKINSLNETFTDRNLDIIKAQQEKIRLLILIMTETVKQNEILLKSSKLSDVNNYKSKLNEYRKPPDKVPLRIPTLNSNIIRDNELSIKIGDFRATLTQASQSSPVDECACLTGISQFLNKAVVIATIPSNYKPLYKVVCVKETEAWILGESKTLARIDIHGSVKEKVIATGNSNPNDITVTLNAELFHSHGESETIKIPRQGEIETLITTPEGWRPKRLHCTGSGDILVHVRENIRAMLNRKNKILRFQGKKIIQEINTDEHGHTFFSKGNRSLYMSENINGDICVSDNNAKQVVVFSKAGKFRFRYDGIQAWRKKEFDPRCIITDSFSHIIVTDFNNNCLHIVDFNGQFLRCVDECGLENPHALSVDSKGRLWVGLRLSGKIKVIEYLNQNIIML